MLRFLEEFARCRTAPDSCRVQIVMGTRIGTLQAAGLLAHAGEMAPQATDALRRLRAMMFRDKAVIDPFRARRMEDNHRRPG
jgi:hypothetical protein